MPRVRIRIPCLPKRYDIDPFNLSFNEMSTELNIDNQPNCLWFQGVFWQYGVDQTGLSDADQSRAVGNVECQCGLT
ncbi:hypothetical protein BaRGS_00001353 [Batillaria attramentaria]|uniref:Uncharacterized protein n=1 Tax=Batillaria attramentaria TaxID=370345 RepID=A0ABD0M7F2_9CAEN